MTQIMASTDTRDNPRKWHQQIPVIMASVMGTVNELVSFAAAMADVKFKGDEVKVG